MLLCVMLIHDCTPNACHELNNSGKMGDALLRARNYLALLVAGIIWAALHWHIGGLALDPKFMEVRKDLYVALSTILGALLGFAITAFSIVTALSNSVVIERLNERGQAKRLFNAFQLAIGALAFSTVMSIVALALDSDKASFNLWLEYITLGAALIAGANVIGVILLLQALTEAVLDSQKK